MLLLVVFIHELDGASFSDELEGMHACFLGGDVGQSAAAGGNAGCFKINAHSPSLQFLLAFSSPLLCSRFFCLTLPQPEKAHMHNCLILLTCDEAPQKALLLGGPGLSVRSHYITDGSV